MHTLEAVVTLSARLLLTCIFVSEGWLKINNYAGTVEYMEANHVSGTLLPLVIITELGGGLAIVFGLLTRLAAFGLAGFALLTALFFHSDFGDPDQLIHFGKNLAIVGGFMMLVAHGPGPWSLDAYWQFQRSDWLLGLFNRQVKPHSPSGKPHERQG